jgi:hypothetical protein
VIDLWPEDESGDDWEDAEAGLLSALVPVRNELMAGDYRALYWPGFLAFKPARSTAAPEGHACLSS